MKGEMNICGRKPLIYWLYLKNNENVQAEDCLGIAKRVLFNLYSHFFDHCSSQIFTVYTSSFTMYTDTEHLCIFSVVDGD